MYWYSLEVYNFLDGHAPYVILYKRDCKHDPSCIAVFEGWTRSLKYGTSFYQFDAFTSRYRHCGGSYVSYRRRQPSKVISCTALFIKKSHRTCRCRYNSASSIVLVRERGLISFDKLLNISKGDSHSQTWDAVCTEQHQFMDEETRHKYDHMVEQAKQVAIYIYIYIFVFAALRIYYSYVRIFLAF